MRIGDEQVKVYLFVATLGYSRRLYVRPFRNERQESWFAGVVGAFHHFGGITEEVDNDRGLVARHDRVICWAAAGCFGVRTLFIAAPWMYALIKAVGAVYLVFVGGQLLWNSWRNKGQFRSRLTEGLPRLSPFHLGLLTTLANPRSAVSVASIFATAMPSQPSIPLSFSVMMLMVAMSACWYTFVACLFAVPYLANGYQRFRRWIDRAAGACLVFFGAKTRCRAEKGSFLHAA